jgi:hypothetical protein
MINSKDLEGRGCSIYLDVSAFLLEDKAGRKSTKRDGLSAQNVKHSFRSIRLKITNGPTNSMTRSCSRESDSSLLDKTYPEFCRTWRFITIFAKACDMSLSSAKLIQSAPSHPIFYDALQCYSPIYVRSSKWSLSFRFHHQYSVGISFPSIVSTYPIKSIVLYTYDNEIFEEKYQSWTSLLRFNYVIIIIITIIISSSTSSSSSPFVCICFTSVLFIVLFLLSCFVLLRLLATSLLAQPINKRLWNCFE